MIQKKKNVLFFLSTKFGMACNVIMLFHKDFFNLSRNLYISGRKGYKRTKRQKIINNKLANGLMKKINKDSRYIDTKTEVL